MSHMVNYTVDNDAVKGQEVSVIVRTYEGVELTRFFALVGCSRVKKGDYVDVEKGIWSNGLREYGFVVKKLIGMKEVEEVNLLKKCPSCGYGNLTSVTPNLAPSYWCGSCGVLVTSQVGGGWIVSHPVKEISRKNELDQSIRNEIRSEIHKAIDCAFCNMAKAIIDKYGTGE